MAKRETFGGFRRATKTEVEAEVAFLLEDLVDDAHPFGPYAQSKYVLHPQDIRSRLQDLVANDRFWKTYEAGFLMRFPSSKLVTPAKRKTAAKAKR